MASQSAVRNFSLPKRSGSCRPFSPLSFQGEQRRDDYNYNGNDTDGCHESGAGSDRVRSPTPTALQLFCFSSDAAARRNPAGLDPAAASRSRILPRPMSTSSSAPALGQASTDFFSPTPQPRNHNDTQFEGFSGDPSSPTHTVWPQAVAAGYGGIQEPDRDKEHGGIERVDDPDNQGRSRSESVWNTDGHSRSRNATPLGRQPASAARSISVRWGPRLRHIPLSEVQAADDAAHRSTAVRRERQLFWTLVAVAMVGVLSCTAAVTLAAAQAALQSGLELDEGASGGGPIWDSRTLGWLIASLVVCAAAAVGLVVATSARCRWGWRGQRGQRGRTSWSLSPSSSPSPSASGSPQNATKETKTTKDGRQDAANRLDSVGRQDAGEGGDRAGWVEMEEMSIGGGDANDGHSNKTASRRAHWWPWKRNAGGRPRIDATTTDNNDSEAAARDEDLNWAKFSRDPVQLRRYVETLEARLAIVEGVSGGEKQAWPRDRRGRDKSSIDDQKNKLVNGRGRTGRTLPTVVSGLVATDPTTSPQRGIRPSASMQTTTSAATAAQPVVGGLAVDRGTSERPGQHSAYSLLLPPASPGSPASMVPSPSPHHPRDSSGSLSLRRELAVNSPPPPLPLPVSVSHGPGLADNRGSILGKLYASR